MPRFPGMRRARARRRQPGGKPVRHAGSAICRRTGSTPSSTASYEKDAACPHAIDPFPALPIVPMKAPANVSFFGRPFRRTSESAHTRPLLNPGYRRPSACRRFGAVPGKTAMCGHNTLAVVNLLPPAGTHQRAGRRDLAIECGAPVIYTISLRQSTLRSDPQPHARVRRVSRPAASRSSTPPPGLFIRRSSPPRTGSPAISTCISGRPRWGQITNQTQIDAQHLVARAEGFVDGLVLQRGVDLQPEQISSTTTAAATSPTQRLIAAMATGLINPFGPSGPEGDALLGALQVAGEIYHTNATTQSIEVKASGTSTSYPPAPLALAVGGEARREQLTVVFPAGFNSGDVITSPRPAQTTSGSRSVGAGFVELSVPVAQRAGGAVGRSDTTITAISAVRRIRRWRYAGSRCGRCSCAPPTARDSGPPTIPDL